MNIQRLASIAAICVTLGGGFSLAHAAEKQNVQLETNSKVDASIALQSIQPAPQVQDNVLMQRKTPLIARKLSVANASATALEKIDVTFSNGLIKAVEGPGSGSCYLQNNIVSYRNVEVTLECPAGTTDIKASVYGTYGASTSQAQQFRIFKNVPDVGGVVRTSSQWVVPLAYGTAIKNQVCIRPMCQTISNPILVEIHCVSGAGILTKRTVSLPYSMGVTCCGDGNGINTLTNASCSRI